MSKPHCYPEAISNLIDTLWQAHKDNAQSAYWASSVRSQSRSMMPVTPFIFEFFIYNSLYSVDWASSVSKELVVHFPENEDRSEAKNQAALEAYMKTKFRESSLNFWPAFRPLLLLKDLNGEWTIADDNPGVKRFFKKLLELQGATEQGLNSVHPVTKKHWELLKECRFFVYQIRNNIFHGSKRLGDVLDENHKKRIGIYQLFLACLVNAVFRALGRIESTSAYIFPEVDIPMGNGHKLHLSRDQQIKLQKQDLMRPADAWLIRLVANHFDSDSLMDPPLAGSCLFYPAACTDMITALLIGLPYCTDFYFYERESFRFENTRKIKRGLCTLFEQVGEPVVRTSCHVYTFTAAGIERSLHWVNGDNLDFLNTKTNLAVYFHRGDSCEGPGSSQNWDSSLFPALTEKVHSGTLRVITQGMPGGIHPLLGRQLETLQINSDCPFSHDGKYFIGTLTAFDLKQFQDHL